MQPVRVVEVPRGAPTFFKSVVVPRPLTGTEAADQVLGDIDALKRVLRGLTERGHAEGFGVDLYGDALDFARAVQAQAVTVGSDEHVVEW
jgi:hypothetical protein